MKIAVICWWDLYSGVELAKAIGLRHDVHYVDREKTKRDYAEAIHNADVIVIKGDIPPKIINGKLYVYNPHNNTILPDMSGHVVKRGCKIICCPAGGNFRRKIAGYHKSYGSKKLSDYTENCDIVAPLTPDLNYPELNGVHLPKAVNTAEYYNAWKPRELTIISAYNGSYDAKGVEKYLMPAIKKLEQSGHKFELIVGYRTGSNAIPHDKFVDLKKNSTVCFGQIAPMGVYGNHELEAMAYGIPTIISENKQSIKQAYPVIDFGKPLLKANDEKELVALLENIITGKIDLQKVSNDTYDYVQRVHSQEAVSKIFEDILKRIM